MKHTFFTVPVAILAVVVVAGLSASNGANGQLRIVPRSPLYHSDPKHLWNRLHRTLFVRSAPDGTEYGYDRLDPLLWFRTRHHLDGRSHEKTVDILDEFIQIQGEKRIGDPLKRALLQRDVWAVFDWLANTERRRDSDSLKKARAKLRLLVANVVYRLALTPHQIRGLPDNYAAAVVSGLFAESFDPHHRTTPYLPRDMFAPDGPWVCLRRPDGPVAPDHVTGHDGFSRSTFFVFLRLPGGRRATLKYLHRLREFDQPMLVERATDFSKFLPNPNAPQFPSGTQVALVRRMMLIDSLSQLTDTKLTESVQLRVYRTIPKMSPKTLEAALVGGTRAHQLAHLWQEFYEFRLSRSALFSGRAGGLRAVGHDERDFDTHFRSHGIDWLEKPVNGRPLTTDPRHKNVLESCMGCHSFPGVYSFNSYLNFRSLNLERPEERRPAQLSNAPTQEIGQWYVRAKQERADWKLLRSLLTVQENWQPGISTR